jgi:hypothetical protein
MASSCPATDAARTVIAQKESLKSLTIDAADRLQYVSQLVDVKHTGASAIRQPRDANDGTCLAFAWRRSGAALVFVRRALRRFFAASLSLLRRFFVVHEDTSS